MKKRNLIIIAITVAVIISGISTWFFFGGEKTGKNNIPSSDTAHEPEAISDVKNTEKAVDGNTETVIPNMTSEEQYAVVFYNTSGVPIDQSVVHGGAAAEVPDLPETAIDNGEMFLGWDKDFTYIFGDTSIAPDVLDISGYKNALYYHTKYVEKGDKVSITLQLGGKVEISAFQILIKYDSSQLKYTDAENTDPAVQLNPDGDSQIKLAFMTVENTTGEVALTDLVFEVIGAPGEASELNITVEKAVKIGSGSEDDIVQADYMVKSGKIYIYK